MDNIIENNKLIAEFMGFIADKSFEVKLVDGINTSYYYYKDDVMYLPETMRYNSSWSWLMEVIEKIEKLSYVRGRHYYLFMEQSYVQIKIDRMNYQPFPRHGTSSNADKFMAIYRAVVKFIKWYNEQNKNNESL